MNSSSIIRSYVQYYIHTATLDDYINSALLFIQHASISVWFLKIISFGTALGPRQPGAKMDTSSKH